MTMSGGDGSSRHFFLNEEHELATITDAGGGNSPNFAPIDWQRKSLVLRRSFDTAASYAVRVKDPSAKAHRFVVTAPASLTKNSTSVRAEASGGKVAFIPSFGGKQANVLTRLGMDLLGVDEQGNATVHIAANKVPSFRRNLTTLRTRQRERSSVGSTSENSKVSTGRVVSILLGWRAFIPTARKRYSYVFSL